MAAYILLLFIAGLWPFNFTEKNNAVISPTGGLEIARHGTAYTASPAVKLQDLKQFAIQIDLVTSSDGLSSFEKIFSYFINQEEMNILLGQWKDGFLPVLRADQKIHTIKLGIEGALRKGERTKFLLSYDGRKLRLYQDGILRNSRETGALSFSSWDRMYPLVVGTDAHGRAQWKGVLYEAAIFDRAFTSHEVRGLSGPSGRKDKKSQNKIAAQPSAARNDIKKRAEGILRQAQDDRPLVHYVFTAENTYETEFRGRKALGVRDQGKGEPADLVVPEQFMPYMRTYIAWDPDWMEYRTNWLDLAVNILGFVPLGMLMIFAARAKKCMSVLVPECLSEEKKEGFGLRASGIGKIEEGLSRLSGLSSRKKEKLKDEIAAQPSAARNDMPQIVIAVILAVVVGFGVSFAIEYLQAYLPSRDSSVRDLATNILGTLIGALATVWLVSRRKSQLC